MTETTNFGLKKPEETDFYSVDTQNDNMDVIDSVLQEFKDGTRRVGDSAKLGGKGASEYITTDGGTIDGNVLVGSDEAVRRDFELFNSIRDILLRVYENGDFMLYDKTHGKNIVTSSADGTNAFNGTASGNVALVNNSTPQVLTYSADTLCINNGNGGKTLLHYYGASVDLGYLGFAEANKPIFQTTGGNAKELLHTGNKPSGTYTGNGDATERTISVGGVNASLLHVIDSSGGREALVGAFGAVVWAYSDTTVKKLTHEQAKFNGVSLITATDSEYLNGSGRTYTYHVY